MPAYFPSAMMAIAVASVTLLPGEAAYTGAYIALLVGAFGLAGFGWPERRAFAHPVSLAILTAIALMVITLPFVYRSTADLLGPVFILPMLATIGLAQLARPATSLLRPATFAALCLIGALVAFLGGAIEFFVLGTPRVGLGNNPIHYASLAAMVGGMALVGIVDVQSRWRYIFLAGPVLGLGATVLSGSRGPMAGALAIAAVGGVFLTAWFWRDKLFRLAALATLCVGMAAIAYLMGTSSDRVIKIVTTAMDIFRFTGGTDDIRAALYSSAVHVLQGSPLFGVGSGQIMDMAQHLYPEQTEVFNLDNLHADWANFAVMGGSIGLIAWLLLISAPLLLLLDVRIRADRATVLGAVLLTTGQIALGVSNATFGILPQTMIFAVMLGYLTARARRLSIA